MDEHRRTQAMERLHVSVTPCTGPGPGPGDTRCTVVLGNGFGTDHTVWNQVLPTLTARARVVRFDWPVALHHYDALRYSRLEAFAEDLLAVIDATDGAPCVMIGHSMAGMVALLAALMRPEAFTHVVMINASPCYVDAPGYRGGFSDGDVVALLDAIGHDYEAWVAGAAPHFIGPEAAPAQVEAFAHCLRALRPDVAYSMVQTIFRADVRARLTALTVPVTVVQSTRDPAVPVEVADYLHRHCPASTLRLLDGDGHLPHLTRAEATAALLGEVLDGLPSGGR